MPGQAETVRRPAVAGAFYPAERDRLASLVDRLLGEASRDPPGSLPVAIVVPHAGYAYSGSVAATAYARLRGSERSPGRVVIAGPAHFAALAGAAVPMAAAWSTPLGTVPVDDELRDIAVHLGASADDRPHAPEHSLEVQLPFLQRVAAESLAILPLAVGDMAPASVADLFDRLRAPADLLVVSTDLSHDHADEMARRRDGQTVDAIVARDPAAIDRDAACGIHALRGVVELARRRRLPVLLLARRNSADAGGDRRRVVGYAALTIG